MKKLIKGSCLSATYRGIIRHIREKNKDCKSNDANYDLIFERFDWTTDLAREIMQAF